MCTLWVMCAEIDALANLRSYMAQKQGCSRVHSKDFTSDSSLLSELCAVDEFIIIGTFICTRDMHVFNTY